MATNTRTIAILNELELQVSVYKLISWHEAALLSGNRSFALFRGLPTPLNLVLRCRYATVCGVAYLRKRLQEGKALCVYISNSRLQSHTLQLLDAHGSAGDAGNYDGEASGLRTCDTVVMGTPSKPNLSVYLPFFLDFKFQLIQPQWESRQ